jgi:hypothetical protein
VDYDSHPKPITGCGASRRPIPNADAKLVLAILAEGDSYGYAIIERVAELSGGCCNRFHDGRVAGSSRYFTNTTSFWRSL